MKSAIAEAVCCETEQLSRLVPKGRVFLHPGSGRNPAQVSSDRQLLPSTGCSQSSVEQWGTGCLPGPGAAACLAAPEPLGAGSKRGSGATSPFARVLFNVLVSRYVTQRSLFAPGGAVQCLGVCQLIAAELRFGTKQSSSASDVNIQRPISYPVFICTFVMAVLRAGKAPELCK
ncbi:unnamed protein product [Coccothraustes coccothraustes]